MDAETPAQRAAARNTSVVHLFEKEKSKRRNRHQNAQRRRKWWWWWCPVAGVAVGVKKKGKKTYASIKKAAQPPCKLPSGLSISFILKKEVIFTSVVTRAQKKTHKQTFCHGYFTDDPRLGPGRFFGLVNDRSFGNGYAFAYRSTVYVRTSHDVVHDPI